MANPVWQSRLLWVTPIKGVRLGQLFQKKSIDKLIADAAQPSHQLRKSLGPWSLTALGIGAIIGTGIFILTGTAAAGQFWKFTPC